MAAAQPGGGSGGSVEAAAASLALRLMAAQAEVNEEVRRGARPAEGQRCGDGAAGAVCGAVGGWAVGGSEEPLLLTGLGVLLPASALKWPSPEACKSYLQCNK